MKFDVITLFPDIIKDYCSYSIVKRGIEGGVISVFTTNPRDFSRNKHKRVDDIPYGGGAGMVMQCEPVFEAYESIERVENSEFIMLTPQGEVFNQKMSKELSKRDQLVLLCGRYEGFDERIRLGLKPREVSVGDFVLTGGELGALVLIDAVSRHLKGFLGKEDSALYDSFSNGLLEHPHYTRPSEFRGMKVPDVLLNGNHAEIDKWRREQSLQRTKERRADLLEGF